MKFKLNRMFQVAGSAVLFVAVQLAMLGGQVFSPPAQAPFQAERYLTHLSTDKPIYRVGEKVYIRGVVLSQEGHLPAGPAEPAKQGSSGPARFEIKGPKGETVTSGFTLVVDSIAGFSWDIPAGQPGGEYSVRMVNPWGTETVERKFDIRAYRAPRLKSQIVFVRDGYGPGDTVAASLHVERAEGGIPAGARVSVSARVDGEETWNGTSVVDKSGNAGTNFKLPAAIARGEGVLAMTVQDGGIVETATKTIPILLQTIDLEIYPEGGDLIAGLPNRVYLEGKTPAKKPADMAGVIVNRVGREVAKFRTEHEGRGRFSFVPATGEAYSLRIVAPAGIKRVFPLPAVKDSGVTVSPVADIIGRNSDIGVRIAATEDGVYAVALSQHGKEFSFKTVRLKAHQPMDLTFTAPRALDGVIVATAFDDHKKPMAERLLFRQPEHSLKVQVTADRSDYVPGDKVTLRVTTTDDTGHPVGVMVGLTVTDSSVLEMLEKRDQAPRLPMMVLLESEVKDLADAHVYLDESNPKAPLATDLLLGTQGWRRFTTYGIGSISGVVTDSTKALVPGVTVTATNPTTGRTTSVVTNESGAYRFISVPVGTYRVQASLPGFQTRMVTDMRVNGSRDARLDFQLNVSSMNTMVEVAVNGRELLALHAASVGQVLAQQRVQDLPIAGNNVLQLLELMPGFEAKKDIVFNGLVAAPAVRDGIGVRDERADAFKMIKAADAANFITVREYAHALRPNYTEGSRVDFAETVYWNAGIKTDSETGRGTVSFNLSDSVTSFRVLADAFAQDGTLGSGTSEVESVQPFSIEPKLPLQVTSGDVIQLPVGMVNGVNRQLRGAELTAKGNSGLAFAMLGDYPTTLNPKERARRVVQINVGREAAGLVNLTLDAKAGFYRDSVSRTLDVRPLGFPYDLSNSGVLDRDGSRLFEFTLPAEMVPGSVSSSVTVYPTPLASMTDALQALIREPYGCFEQTSSTSYPMVMAQQYFLTHSGIEPAIIEKTRNLLDVSYKRLLGFQSQRGGYEWFGADPGHEALTAYGLLQFTDMAQVRDVDKAMLDRTRSWLLSRRDGKGGFSLNSRALDSFGGAPAETTKAYIVWALTEAGEKGLDKEIASVKASATSTQDSYVIALAANILYSTGDRAGARELMDKLVKNQDAAGNVKNAVTSITRSGGEGLAIETTALSMLAWMRESEYASNVEKGLRWLNESNRGGRFGSTQSTILALRSIVAYDKANAKPKAAGRLVLTIDGEPVGTPLAFTPETQGALVFPEFSKGLSAGKHKVALRMEAGSRMPFSISVKYHSTLPDSSEKAQIGIQVSLRDRQIQEGGVTEAAVSIANKSDRVIPTPVAIVGIPGGLEVRHDQLKELVKSGKIDAYEVIGREVVLYWRFLKAKDKVEIPLSLVAAVPGSYTGPASRAYLYYTDEYKNWAPGLAVNIARR